MDGGGCFPRELRRRARRRQPARRGRLVSEGRRPHDRLPGVRSRADEEARLVGRADRGREEGGRGQELEDRPLGRHPARCDEKPRLPSVRQRQGARGRLELPRRHPATPRAALLAAPRPGRQVSDARRQEGVLAAARRCTRRVQKENVAEGCRQEFPAGPHERPPGRIRRRRRGDAVEPVARRAAAGELRRDQSRRTPTTAGSRTASMSG